MDKKEEQKEAEPDFPKDDRSLSINCEISPATAEEIKELEHSVKQEKSSSDSSTHEQPNN